MGGSVKSESFDFCLIFHFAPSSIGYPKNESNEEGISTLKRKDSFSSSPWLANWCIVSRNSWNEIILIQFLSIHIWRKEKVCKHMNHKWKVQYLFRMTDSHSFCPHSHCPLLPLLYPFDTIQSKRRFLKWSDLIIEDNTAEPLLKMSGLPRPCSIQLLPLDCYAWTGWRHPTTIY